MGTGTHTPARAPEGRLATFLGTSVSVIATLFVARFVTDTVTRMVYPFSPQLAAGLGLSVPAFSWAISARSWVGLAGPVFGLAADRLGQKRLMIFGLLVEALAMASLLFLGGGWSFLSMILLGIGSSAFVPAQQSYISDQVPYERRGRAIALVDMAFASAGVLALPVFGVLLDQFGWRLPVGVVTGMCALALVLIWRALPKSTFVAPIDHVQLRLDDVPAMLVRPRVIASILVMLLLFFALSSFATIWSIWLYEAFKLDTIAIGLLATLTGLAELTGVLASALFIDRFGKRRSVLAALSLATLLFVFWGLNHTDLTLSKILIVAIGALLELTVVSLFPLLADQLPESRAMLFSLAGLGASVGLALGSPIAVMLWQWNGLAAVCATCAAGLLAAIGLTLWQLHSAR